MKASIIFSFPYIPTIKNWTFLIGFVLLTCASTPNAQLSSISSIPNFHQVNDSIYRSGQPGKASLSDLDSQGIRSLINLRILDKSGRWIESPHIEQFHLPLFAYTMREKHLIRALHLLQSSQKPVLIHCRSGSHRTGALIAAYRIIIENWSKEAALEEMLDPAYGFNKKRYPQLIKLIQEMDVEKVRNAIGVIKS